MRSVPNARNEFDFDFSATSSVRWHHGSEASRDDPVGQSLEYFINDTRIAERFGQTLNPLLADWIDVALACYSADRLATRGIGRNGQPGGHWSRVLRLTVPVREVDNWKSKELQSELAHVLRFLTEDAWSFDFVPRTGLLRLAESQGFLFGSESGDGVHICLYSGGLDSFAGAAQMLRKKPTQRYVFVSGVTNVRQQAAQRGQIGGLQARTPSTIYHLVVPYGLRWARAHVHRVEETSQRTRGFLFLTLGGVSAVAAHASELHLSENGIGAINLPYDGTQIGAYNSRATNPIALLYMERFIRALTGQSVGIKNDFLFSTKAEMCAHEAVKGLGDHVHLTFSCDGFPVRTKNKAQCGSCTSCLLRRQALECAGLSRFDSDGYLRDLSSPGYAGTQRHLDSLRAMDWQARKIRLALAQPNPWDALVNEFVELKHLELELARAGKMEPSELRSSLLRLYSRYTSEWELFCARRYCHVEQRVA
jgi:7-cyano-7-deazaguanine synthase in queuosine biosynthesis